MRQQQMVHFEYVKKLGQIFEYTKDIRIYVSSRLNSSEKWLANGIEAWKLLLLDNG